MQSELNPCPFCGSKATLFKNERGYWGTCTNNDCDAETSGRVDPNEAASIWNRRAALSDRQAGEVRIKPLEWKHDGNGSFAYCGVTDTRWVANNAEERAKADATRASRIRSALVDVPAVEPVAWQKRHCMPGHYGWSSWESGRAPTTDFSGLMWEERPLYASPHREGEDSAEVLKALKEAVEFANKANNYIAGQDLPASAGWLAVIAKADAALAATRSGSATAAKGGRNDG